MDEEKRGSSGGDRAIAQEEVIRLLRVRRRPSSRLAEREAVLILLYAIDRNLYRKSAREVAEDLEGAAGAFEEFGEAVEVVEKIVRRRVELDSAIARALPADWPLHRVALVLRLIARVMLWENLEQKLPKEVAIDEALNLCRIFAEEESVPFMNALLDRVMIEHGVEAASESGDSGEGA